MEKFRINNDLSIFWSITEKDGSPYSLSDKTVRLFVTHPRGRMDVTSDITVQDNVICWLFRGSRQRYLGTYKITVEIQASPADRTIRKDIPEAFELVSSTQYEQTEIGRPDINEEGELTLATSLDIFQIKPIIPQVGPNRNWWVDGADTGKSSVGLTAYEFAKENGYEGTEEEYAAECLAVPVLNEESRIATAAALKATEQSIAQQESVNNYMNDVAEPTIARATKAASDAEQVAADIRSEADAALEGLDSAINSVNEAAETANTAASNATSAATRAENEADRVENNLSQISSYMGGTVYPAVQTAKNAAAEATAAAEQAEKDVDAAIEAFGPAIANKADLDNGKIIPSQLPDYILGQVMYGGLIYDDHTISPSSNFISKYGNQTYLSASDASKYSGVYFIASGSFTDRTIVGVPQVSTGDWIISTGQSWAKVDNSDAVTSVAGLVGNVNASALAAVLADLKDANSLARKSEFKTINGQSLVGTGNIKIEGKNYDTQLAEQSAKLTELSAENERLKERIEEQDQFIEDLQNTKIDRENDDYYPKMAVGLADNLAGVDVVDSEINFRRSGGGAISDGVARIETIKGNSVVWNDLVQKRASSSSATGITATWGDDKIHLQGTYDAVGDKNIYSLFKSFQTLDGHSYAVIASGAKFCSIYAFGSLPATHDARFIVKATSGNAEITLRVDKFASAGQAIDEYVAVIITDLTKMFGSGNEPTTIEEFYARIPMGVDLNAYNEGEVIHMDVQSIESQGVNAWDEEWEVGSFSTTNGSNVAASSTMRMKNAIPVLPNATYYCKATVDTWVLFLDKNGKVIEGHSTGLSKYENACNVKNTSFLTPSNAAYIRAYFNQYFANTTTYNHDICINLSDASINGKYFPYIKRVEDLSIIRKYFPNGMKSAGTAHDEIRYNKESGKREYSKGRMKEVDMGTLNWNYTSGNISKFSCLMPSDARVFPDNVVPNLMTRLYAAQINDANKLGDKNIYRAGSYLGVLDSSYTDAASFKAAMQGVILYYEAAEWEWVELDEADQYKDFDIQVWNGGTEKANAEGKSAPLAADITYGFNAIGKIKELESLVAALRAKVGI